MELTRREVLKLGVVGTGALLGSLSRVDQAEAASLPIGACVKAALPASPLTPRLSPLVERFKAPLFIPQALNPSLQKEATDSRAAIDYYEITMQKQRLGFVFDEQGNPLKFAEFWTYNGTTPGPLIRQTKGRQSCIRFINQLGADAEGADICTSVHLHGMASLPQFDGYAEDLIPQNHYKDYYYPNVRASTLWYHDHAVHKTSRNVYMGLAGMYIVEFAREDFCQPEAADRLPSGEFEIPLIIQDKSFEIANSQKPDDWKLVFNDRQRRGVYSDLILVNGRAYPTLKVSRRKYYFRMLNASASRTYQLTLSRQPDRLTLNQDPLTVIASDAGLLSQPEPLIAPRQSLRIGVAERYGVVIDFADFPADVKTVYLWDMGFAGNINAPAQALMQFELEGEPIQTADLPAQLGKVTLPEELLRIRSEQLRAKNRPIPRADRTFRFGRGQDWTINGRTWNAARVEANPGLWDVEVWEFVNTGGWTHPVHVHLVDFQVLDRNNAAPLPFERGWKDVVVTSDLEKVRVIASFNPQPGKYMIHCHNIVHEDHDMMTQFEVMRQRPEDPPSQDPLSAPAQPLPAQPLGAADPPLYPLSPFSYGKLKNSCD